MWGLSKEEIYLLPWEKPSDFILATLRHVYEEGEKYCPHPHGYIPWRKRECSECWAELKKEAGW